MKTGQKPSVEVNVIRFARLQQRATPNPKNSRETQPRQEETGPRIPDSHFSRTTNFFMGTPSLNLNRNNASSSSNHNNVTSSFNREMASKQRQQPSFSHASTVRSSVGVETLEHNTGSNGSPNHFNENNTLNSTSHFNHYSNITNSNSFNISKDENNVASAAFEFPEPLKKKTEARGPVPRLDIHLLRGEEEEKQARLPPMSNELVMQPPTILEMAPTQETTPEKPMHYTTHKIEDFELDDDVYFIDGTSKTVAKEKMAKKSFETSPFSGSGGRTAGKTQPSPVIDPWRNPSKFASQGFDLSPWEQKGYFQRRDVFSDLHGLRPENPIMSAEPKRPFDWDRLGGYYPPLGHPKPSSQDYVPSPSPARKNTSNSTTKMRHAHQAAFDNKASYEQWNHNLKDSMNVTNVLYPIYMEVGIIRNELDDLKKSVSVAVQYSARSEEMAETGTQTEMAAADHRAESNKPKGKVSSVRGERREEPIPEPLVIMFPEIRTEPRVVPLPPTKHSRPAVKLSDGSTYEGEWFGDVKEGLGILVYPDGAIYTGEFKEDKKHGRGKLCTAKGHDVYEGDFQNDVINGYGVFTSPNLFCEGFWANGQMEGIGAMKYKGGMAYEGNFKGGKKEGEGRLIFPNQDIYKGAFLNDVPHGNGLYKYQDGRVYDGDWVNFKKEGFGKFYYPDRRYYEGVFKEDKRHGKGILKWPDGRVYEGEFVADKMHGNGQFVQNGQVSEGIFENGKYKKGSGSVINLATSILT